MMANNKIDRAEELRKHIKSKNFTKSGLERMMAVFMTQLSYLEEELEKGDDTGYKVLQVLNSSHEGKFKFVDAMAKTAEDNGEIEDDVVKNILDVAKSLSLGTRKLP